MSSPPPPQGGGRTDKYSAKGRGRMPVMSSPAKKNKKDYITSNEKSCPSYQPKELPRDSNTYGTVPGGQIKK